MKKKQEIFSWGEFSTEIIYLGPDGTTYIITDPTIAADPLDLIIDGYHKVTHDNTIFKPEGTTHER